MNIKTEKSSEPTALITGAGRRIGASIAEQLHLFGFRVAIHYHESVADAQNLCDRLNAIRPDSARIFNANLTSKSEIQSLVADTLVWSGRLDALINNASQFIQSSLDADDDVHWDALFAINVKSPYWLSLAAREALARQKGTIINITDIHADSPLKGYSVYCQTKAALLMQTKALALEFSPEIRVNAIAPGATMWPEGANMLTDKLQEEIIEKTLLKRHGEPKFIAQAVVALVTNVFITGQSLRVDGGRSSR
jgi:pteridine reductase